MSDLFGDDELAPINRVKQALFDEYGYTDGRIKNIEKMDYFRVDVMKAAMGANGRSLSSVCEIHARVETEDRIQLTLTGSVPLDGAVKIWRDTVGKPLSDGQKGTFTILLKPRDQDLLSSLANAMRVRLGHGQPPLTSSSHRHSPQEIAEGLDHLRNVLDTVWK